MKNRMVKCLAMLVILCLMATMLAVPFASAATTYSKVYGQTQDKIRVRDSASTNATIIDNIVEGACVYVTSSKTSGNMTFVQIQYRDLDGNIATGWACQSDGEDTYVKILTDKQAESSFNVEDGKLPSTRVGTFNATKRKASQADADNTYIRLGSSGDAVKELQAKLDKLGYYNGDISGNVGERTEEAIKAFQKNNGLTADGVAGPQTLAKIDAAYNNKTADEGKSSASNSNVLKLNSTGDAVSQLQKDLTTLGYYWAEVTGSFGERTEEAVERFQKANGLTADGQAGEKTLAAIAAAVAKKGASTSTTSTSSSSNALKLNSTGDAVSQLQRDLTTLGYYWAEVTGSFGERTEEAVERFQKANGLTVDGQAGEKTLAAIAAAVAKKGSSTTTSGGTSTSNGSVLKLDSTGEAVSQLQRDLTTLGYYWAEVTGKFGERTEEAVERFQKANGLTADGQAGEKTLAAIAAAVAKKGTQSAEDIAANTGMASDDNSGILKLNSTGEAVRQLQKDLTTLGYYWADITGSFGEKTEEAVKRFQKAYGLDNDGRAGQKTLEAIKSALAKLDPEDLVGTGAIREENGDYMKLNSSGTEVRSLQLDLTTLGYYWADITGNYGEKTEAAVKAFQKENGLDDDGVAGPKTVAAIAAAIAKKGGSTADSSAVVSGSVLKLNSKGDKVTQLQKDLQQLGYYYTDITGSFGEKTEAAVKAFQKAYNLDDDGVAGPKTLEAIERAIANAGGSASGSGTASDSAIDGLKLGSTGGDVRALQTNLTTLGYYYGDITGHFGPMTQTAVKKFQKDRGLSQDGVAGDKTIAAINSALNNIGSTPAGTTSTALREGDTGAAVTELQTMLKALDYYYGDITGHFGSLTKSAVKVFQDDNDLTVDGVAGNATMNKLRSLTNSGSSSSSGSGSTVTTANSYGRITKDNVYLRSQASTSSAAKDSLKKGTLVRISKTYTTSDAKWYYISVKSGSYTLEGYVRSDMMETISETEYNNGGGDSSTNSSDIETLGMIRVTGDNVSLRYEPSTSATRVGSANTGDVFYYVDRVTGWYQTKNGYWISSTYAKVMSDDEINSYLGTGSATSYKLGSTGSTVSYIQTALTELGYYTAEITGHFGEKTEAAVKAFQKANGLTNDGVVGADTLAKIMEKYNPGGSDAVTNYTDTVYNVDWFANKSKLNNLGLTRGKTATLTDLWTGRSFKIYVQSTGNHADVEPLTSSDTATMCTIYGVSSASKINWRRRPMLITLDGGVQLVCSIYGTPHGSEVITDNNFNGQFCLHFLNSKTHGTDRVDTDEDGHQEMIAAAVAIMKNKTVNGVSVQVLDELP